MEVFEVVLKDLRCLVGIIRNKDNGLIREGVEGCREGRSAVYIEKRIENSILP